jgi:uncharacterized repeat protein (TIGR03803 family)
MEFLKFAFNRFRFVVLIPACLFAITAMAADGPKETVLYNFDFFAGNTSQGYPMAGVILDKTGALYGTTILGNYDSCFEGGACGTVFKLTPPSQNGGPWTETALYSFLYQDAYPPDTNLVFDTAGNLYGGAGPNQGANIFQLTESSGNWNLNPIYTAGAGTPLFDKHGNLFVLGDATNGSVVELVPQSDGTWNPVTLYAFNGGTDGKYPEGGVVADAAGNLYGATLFGGSASNCGTVFELSPQTNGTWVETILYRFVGGANDGCYPQASVILDRKGNLYGTTENGGPGPCTGGCGAVFELSPPTEKGGAWTETVLHQFSNNDGANPYAGLAIDSTGALYGTTSAGGNGSCEPLGAGCGTVFRLTPPAKTGGTWTHVFYSFQGSDGQDPQGNVTLDESKGLLYGTTRDGGAYGYGTVFQVVR